MQQRNVRRGAPSESINTVDWSRRLGHDQAQLHRRVNSLLAIGGQRPVDALGRLLHEGDLPAQIALAMDNLTDVVLDAGMALADLVHLRVHTSDIAAFLDSHFVIAEHLDAHGSTTPVTMIEVARLAIPGMEIEIDGLAVRADPPSESNIHTTSPTAGHDPTTTAPAARPPHVITPPPPDRPTTTSSREEHSK